MSHNSQLYQWIDNVSTHFPNLSKPMIMGLALWSFGSVVCREVVPRSRGWVMQKILCPAGLPWIAYPTDWHTTNKLISQI